MRWKVLVRCAAAMALVVTLAGCPSSFLYYPDKEMRATPALYGLPYESIHFETKDRVLLSGWWVPAREPPGVILFCHGNGGNVSHFLESLVVWNRMGLSVLAFDYRGYGLSGGRPSEQGTYRDAEAAWDYLVEVRKVPPEKIVVLGRSLGGPIAAWLAATRTPRALVIESSFTSIAALVKDMYSWIPAHTLFGDTYPTEKYLERAQCPVLIVHSPDDEIVPFAHGRTLYGKAHSPKQFLATSGSHNAGFSQSLAVYEPALKAFTGTHLRADGQ